MKYEHCKGTPCKEYVSWPGFSIETVTGQGAACLAEELNRLADIESGLREDLRVQIEAKCKAIKRVEAFEFGQTALVDFFRNDGRDYGQFGDDKGWTPVEAAVHALHDLTVKNRDLNARAEQLQGMNDKQAETIRDLTEKLERSNAGVSLISKKLVARRDTEQKLVTAIRESQQILSDYLTTDKSRSTAINELLEVLDHGDLVTLVSGNSEEATPGEPYLDMLSSKPTNWPYWATHLFRDEDGWQFGKLFRGQASKAWYDSDTQATASRLWREENIIDGTLEERPGVTLKTAINAAGQEYVCGLGVGVDPSQFIIDADKVYINGAAIETGTLVHTILDGFSKVISETQLGKMVTTNHFAPEPKASKKQLAALKSALTLIDHEGREDIHKHLRKLVKKLS